MESSVFFIVLGVLLAAVLLRWMAFPAHGGARGEQAVHGILRQSLPSSDYAVLRDVLLPGESATVRIDHVVVSRFGIFVIRTLDLDGWIFGRPQDSHWIHSLEDSREEFPNPLRENQAHIRALQELLGLRATKFHSLVVFAGKAEFRNPMPVNVMQVSRLVAYVEVRNTPLLSLEEAALADQAIETRRLEPGAADDALPVEALRARRAEAGPRYRSDEPAPARERQGFGARLATRTLAAAASIALLLAVGDAVVGGLEDWKSLGGAWPGFPAGPMVSQPVTVASPEEAASETTPAPAGLRCAYNPDAQRCACYDPEGGKVPMNVAACEALVEQSAR